MVFFKARLRGHSHDHFPFCLDSLSCCSVAIYSQIRIARSRSFGRAIWFLKCDGNVISFLSSILRFSFVCRLILQIASAYHNLANTRPVGSENHLQSEDTLQTHLKSGWYLLCFEVTYRRFAPIGDLKTKRSCFKFWGCRTNRSKSSSSASSVRERSTDSRFGKTDMFRPSRNGLHRLRMR
jgi:hypothetical protein